MILYHGSNIEIQEIDLALSKPNKDFGKGFYLSADKSQAMEMASYKAVILGGTPIVTGFEFDESVMGDLSYKVKTFDGYSREWADFIFLNRNNPDEKPVHDFDIVYGPIANDKVGLQIRKLKDGSIDFDEFLNRLKYMKGITFQYFFGTEAATKH